MTVTYTNNNRVIEITNGNYKYVVTSMIVLFKYYVKIEGQILFLASNGKEYLDSDLSLIVNNDSYRDLSDLSVVDASVALTNGTLNSGYIGELDLFVELFGHNSADQPNKMYPFIVDAIQRKYNLS